MSVFARSVSGKLKSLRRLFLPFLCFHPSVFFALLICLLAICLYTLAPYAPCLRSTFRNTVPFLSTLSVSALTPLLPGSPPSASLFGDASPAAHVRWRNHPWLPASGAFHLLYVAYRRHLSHFAFVLPSAHPLDVTSAGPKPASPHTPPPRLFIRFLYLTFFFSFFQL